MLGTHSAGKDLMVLLPLILFYLSICVTCLDTQIIHVQVSKLLPLYYECLHHPVSGNCISQVCNKSSVAIAKNKFIILYEQETISSLITPLSYHKSSLFLDYSAPYPTNSNFNFFFNFQRVSGSLLTLIINIHSLKRPFPQRADLQKFYYKWQFFTLTMTERIY